VDLVLAPAMRKLLPVAVLLSLVMMALTMLGAS
jgi:hypothetical protein